MMNDVRFLGVMARRCPMAHAKNPYNINHTPIHNPDRHWDSQYPASGSLTAAAGRFLILWTPSTFAHAGMLVSDTETPGRAYQISSEHHVHNEIEVRNAAHWSFYALQTEREWGEGGLCLPIEIDSSSDVTVREFPQLTASFIRFNRFRGR